MSDRLSTLKMVWAYMLEAGCETTGEWNMYSGDWEKVRTKSRSGYKWDQDKKNHDALLALVKQTGIDWEKTEQPESAEHSGFNGTFVENSSVPTLLGTLWLKDGTSTQIGVSGAEKRFSDYAKHLAALFEDEQRMKRILGE